MKSKKVESKSKFSIKNLITRKLKKDDSITNKVINKIETKNVQKKSSSITKMPVVKKMKTGVIGFDKLMKEGIPEGSSVIIEGGPGSGKTIFCLNILGEACKKGKKVLYMSFEEPENKLRQHMIDFGYDPHKFEEQGLLKIKRFSALDIARSVEALLSEAKKELLIDLHPVLIPKDFSPDILILDSLSSISSAFSGEESRFRVYMEQLFRYLEANDITSFLIREEAHPGHLRSAFTERGEAISFLSDGIIVIYSVIYTNGLRGRAVEFLKMRGEEIEQKIVEAKIVNKKGFVVDPNKMITGKYNLT